MLHPCDGADQKEILSQGGGGGLVLCCNLDSFLGAAGAVNQAIQCLHYSLAACHAPGEHQQAKCYNMPCNCSKNIVLDRFQHRVYVF